MIEVSRAIAKLHRGRLTAFNLGCEKKKKRKKSYEDLALNCWSGTGVLISSELLLERNGILVG